MENATNSIKKTAIGVGIIVAFLCFANLPLMKLFLGSNDCQFSNADGSFTFAEVNFKGAGYTLCKEIFIEFKHRRLGDSTLYRLCPKKPFYFWNYGEYLFAEKYRLPYKPWSEIERRRGAIRNKSGFQDF